MRILFLANAGNIHTVKWVNILSGMGHEIYLAYIKNHKDSVDIIDPKVKLYELPLGGAKSYYLNAYFLRKITNTIKPDVINVHYASGYGTLARISRVKPIALNVWGSDVYDFPYQSRKKFDITIKNLKYADHIISTSEVMANQVRKLLSNPKFGISIVPFGVRLDQFTRNKENKSYKEEKIILGTVKTLRAIYDIETQIHAYKFVLDYYNESCMAENLEFYIYGQGELEFELKLLTRKLKIEEKVHFMGYIPNSEIPNALENIDIFVLSSIQESFGVAAVEAFAMGLPVVATDADGFKEVINDGIDGIIVPKQNPEAMGNAIINLIENTFKRENMGKNGRKKVEKLYDINKNAVQLIEAYKKAINS